MDIKVVIDNPYDIALCEDLGNFVTVDAYFERDQMIATYPLVATATNWEFFQPISDEVREFVAQFASANVEFDNSALSFLSVYQDMIEIVQYILELHNNQYPDVQIKFWGKAKAIVVQLPNAPESLKNEVARLQSQFAQFLQEKTLSLEVVFGEYNPPDLSGVLVEYAHVSVPVENKWYAYAWRLKIEKDPALDLVTSLDKLIEAYKNIALQNNYQVPDAIIIDPACFNALITHKGGSEDV